MFQRLAIHVSLGGPNRLRPVPPQKSLGRTKLPTFDSLADRRLYKRIAGSDRTCLYTPLTAPLPLPHQLHVSSSALSVAGRLQREFPTSRAGPLSTPPDRTCQDSGTCLYRHTSRHPTPPSPCVAEPPVLPRAWESRRLPSGSVGGDTALDQSGAKLKAV